MTNSEPKWLSEIRERRDRVRGLNNVGSQVYVQDTERLLQALDRYRAAAEEATTAYEMILEGADFGPCPVKILAEALNFDPTGEG